MALGLEIKLLNESQIEKKYLDFIDKLSQKEIKLNVNTTQLENISNEFKKINDFINKDFKLNFSSNVDNIDKGFNDINNNLDKITEKQIKTNKGFKTFERSVTETNEALKQTVTTTDKIDAKTGEVTGTFKNITNDTKKLNNELGKTQDKIDKTVLVREKEAKLLEKNQARAINKALEQEWKDREKIQEKINETIKQRQKEQQLLEQKQAKVTNKNLEEEWNKKNLYLFNDIKKINNDILNIKKQIIKTNDISSLKKENNLYKEQLNILNQRRRKLINSLTNNRGMSSERELTIRKQIQNNLQKTYELEKLHNIEQQKNTDSLKKQIELYKEQANIKLKNLNSRYGSLTEKDDIQKQINDYKKALTGLNTSNFNTKEMDLQFRKIESDVKSTSLALKNTQKDVLSFGDSFKLAFSKLTLWMGATAIFFKIAQEIEHGVGVVKTLDDSLTTMNLTMDGSKQKFDQMGQSAMDYSLQMKTSLTNTLQAMEIYTNLNASVDEILKKSKASIVLSNLTGKEVSQSADALQGLIYQFDLTEDSANHLDDVLTKLASSTGMEFSRSIESMTESVARGGATASQAGLNVEQFLSIVSTVAETSRLQGSAISSGMTTIFSRISRVSKLGGDEISKLEKGFKKLGIHIRDGSGEFYDMWTILKNIHNVYGKLNSTQRSYVNFMASGTRQSKIFANIMKNFDKIQQRVNDSMNSEGFAMKRNDIYAQSLSAKMQNLRNIGDEMWISLINDDGIKHLVDDSASLVGGYSNIAKALGLLPTALGTATIAGLIFSKTFRDFATNLPVKIVKGIKNITLSSKKMGLAFSILPHKIHAIDTTTGEAITKISLMGKAFDVTKLKAVAFGSVITLGLSVLAGIVITKVIGAIDDWIHHTERLKEVNQELLESYNENTQKNNDMIKFLQNEGSEYDVLSQKTNLTAEEQKKLADIKERISQQFPSLIQGYDSETGQIILQKKSTEELIEMLKEKNKLENTKLLLNGNNALKEKQRDYIRKQEKINELMQKSKTLQKGSSGLGLNYYIDGLKKLRNETEQDSKEYIQYTNKINELESQRGDVLKQINVLQSEQKNVLGELKLYINAIYNDKNLDDFQKKLADVGINWGKLIGDNGFDFNNAKTAVDNFVKKINEDNSINNIKIATKLEKPKSSDYDNYFNAIENLSKKTKTKPVELMQEFKVNSQSVDKYISDLQSKFSKASGKAKKDIKDKINLAENIKIKVSEEGMKNVESKAKQAQQALDDLKKTFQDTTSKIKDYNSFLNELNKNHVLSAESISKVVEKYPDLILYINDETKLRQKLNEKIQEQAKVNQDTLYNMHKNDTVYYNNLLKLKNGQVNQFNKMYNVDLNNYRDLSESKLKISGQLIKTLAEKWSGYYKVLSDGTAELDVESIMMNTTGEVGSMNRATLEVMKKVQTDVDKYNSKFKKAIDDLNKIAFGGVTSKLSKLGSETEKTSGKTKAGTKAVNEAKEVVKAYENALKSLELQLAKINQQLENSGKHTNDYIKALNNKKKIIESEINLNKQRISTYNQLADSMKNVNNVTTTNSSSSTNSSMGYTGSYASLIKNASKKYGVDPNLVSAIIQQESGFNPKARSNAGAMGLMQLMPSTAKGLGVTNAYDPAQAIEGGTKHIAYLLKKYGGDIKLVLAGYNAGVGNVAKYHGIPPFDETKGYINKVMGYFKQFSGGKLSIPHGSSGSTDSHKVQNESLDLVGKATDIEKKNLDLQQQLRKVNAEIQNFYDYKIIERTEMYNKRVLDSQHRVKLIQDEITKSQQKIDYLSIFKNEKAKTMLLEEQNKIYDEQQKKLHRLYYEAERHNDSIYGTFAILEQQFRKDFKSDIYGLGEKSETDFQRIKEHLFPVEDDFNKVKIQAFDKWVKDYINVRNALKDVKTQTVETHKAITELNKTRIDLKVNIHTDEVTNLDEEITNIQNKINRLQDTNGDPNEINKLIDEIIVKQKLKKNEYLETVTILELEKTKVKEGSEEWLYINGLLEKYNELLDASNYKLDKQIKEIYSKYEANIKSIETTVIEMIKKKYELEKKATLENLDNEMKAEDKRHKQKVKDLDNEKKHYDEIIDRQLKLIDSELSKHSFDNKITDLQKKRADLQSQFDSLALVDTPQGNAMKETIKKQIEELDKQIKEEQYQREKDLQKKSLQEKKEKYNKDYEKNKEAEDKKYNDVKESLDNQKKAIDKHYEILLKQSNLYTEARKVIESGYFKDVKGNILDLKTAIKNYYDDWGEGLSILGQKIKNEVIDKLVEVQNILKNTQELKKIINGIGKNHNNGNSSGKDNKYSVNSPLMNRGKIYATGVDYNNAKKYLSGYGYTFVDISKHPISNSTLTQDDVIAGGTATKYIKGYQPSNKATKLIGHDRYDTLKLIESFKKRLVQGSYRNGTIVTRDHIAQLHGTESDWEAVLNKPQIQELLNRTIEATLNNTVMPEMKFNIPDYSNTQSISQERPVIVQVDKMVNIEGNADENIIPQIQQQGENVLYKIKQNLKKRI